METERQSFQRQPACKNLQLDKRAMKGQRAGAGEAGLD